MVVDYLPLPSLLLKHVRGRDLPLGGASLAQSSDSGDMSPHEIAHAMMVMLHEITRKLKAHGAGINELRRRKE